MSDIKSCQSHSQKDAMFERKGGEGRQPICCAQGNGQTIGKNEMYSGKSVMENGINSA